MDEEKWIDDLDWGESILSTGLTEEHAFREL